MTPEELRGRRFTFAIAAWLGIVPTILLLVAVGSSRRPATASVWTSTLFSATINLLLFWLLYKAYRWTRIYIAASLFVSALVPSVRLLYFAQDFTTAAQFGAAFLIVLPRLVNVFIASVLWRSSSVTAYFDRENEIPALNLNTRSGQQVNSGT